MPLRADFLVDAVSAPSGGAGDQLKLKVLVLGGSQGASFVNRIVCDWASQHLNEEKVALWHQSGESHYEKLKEQYAELIDGVKLEPFITDVLAAYQWADLVICRAGAMTVSEIIAVAKPAVFVPFPAAVDDHQFHNARRLCDQGAAIIIRQADFSVARLEAVIKDFLQDSQRLVTMSHRLKDNAKPEATNAVCEQLFLASGCGGRRCINVE